MNDEIINKLIEYMKTTGDFILENAPTLINEILTYEKWSAFLGIIISVVMIPTLILIFIYFLNNPMPSDRFETRSFASLMGMLIPGFLFIPFFINIFVQTGDLLKIYLAPRYYLIKLLIQLKDK